MSPNPSSSSRRQATLWALCGAFALGVLLGACGDGRGKCAQVSCNGGRVCDPATGACVAGDGGTGGGGGADGGGGGGGTVDGGADGGPSCTTLADGGQVCTCNPACTSGVCNPATGACVQCLTDANCSCPASQCSADNVCGVPDGGAPQAPAGAETCDPGPELRGCGFSFTTNTATAVDNEAATRCGAGTGGGRDLAWKLVLDATSNVTITARPSAGSLARPMVSLRRGCDPQQQLACASPQSGNATLTLKSLPPGTYGLIVDSYDGTSSGSVDVTVTLSAPTPPPNETCGTAIDLPTDGTPVTVDLSPADSDLELGCNPEPSGNPEVMYRVVLTAASDVVAIVAPLDGGVLEDGGARPIDPVIALLPATCDPAYAKHCVDYQYPGYPEQLVVRNLAAGTYYLVLESWGPEYAGPMAVSLNATPAAGPPSHNTCAAPQLITFEPGSNSTAFEADTGPASDDARGTCNATASSAELVFRLDIATSQTVTIEALPPSAAIDPVLYLERATCDPAPTVDGGVEVACVNAQPAGGDEIISQVLTPGTYYLFVETRGPAAGPMVISVVKGP